MHRLDCTGEGRQHTDTESDVENATEQSEVMDRQDADQTDCGTETDVHKRIVYNSSNADTGGAIPNRQGEFIIFFFRSDG